MMIPKFRAWDGKYMEYDFFVSSHGNPYDYADVVHDTPNMETVEAPHFKIMQSTGLKDKNGVEIFEGDIVKICTLEGYPLGAVEWDEVLACYEIDDNEKYQFGGEHVTWFHTKDFEVISNIYENPELLEGARNEK